MTPTVRQILKRLQLVLFVGGALALGYTALVLIHAHFYQKTAMQRLEQLTSRADTRRPAGVPEPQPEAEGTAFARFEMPRLKLDLVVVEGDNEEDLRRGIGHIPGTALPGAPGNVGIAGHRDTFFRPLRNVRAGDQITLRTAGSTHRYRVESTEVVTPDRSDVLNPTREPQLTLVTCFPFYYVGSAPKRFIIHAREVSADASGQAVSSDISRAPPGRSGQQRN
jgi:sortase A